VESESNLIEFSVARPDVVRAINQRWLINYWKHHLGEKAVPRWQEIEPSTLKTMSSHLSFLDVVGSGPAVRFQFRYQGAAVTAMHGSGNWRGKFLDEVMPPNRKRENLPAYRQTVASGRPVYTIYDVRDRNGLLVHYERLLLPFAGDGRTIDRILASFELVCEDGAFESNAIMISQSDPPTLRRAAVIELT